jgi:tetratricopeptide (TPR) repeat protein
MNIQKQLKIYIATLCLLILSLANTVSLLAQDPKKENNTGKEEKKEEGEDKEQEGMFGMELSSENFIFGDAMEKYLLENMMGQDFKKSLPLFKAVTKMYPNNAAAHFKIAEIYVKKDSVDKAAPYAKKALELNTQNKYYYTLLAEIYHKQTQFTNAIEVYQNLIKNIPNNESYYYNIANIYLFQERYKEAIEMYERLEKKIGIEEEVIRKKQKVYLSLKDHSNAIKEGQKLIDAYPDVVEYKEAQAELLLKNGKIEESKALLLKILEVMPENSYARVLLSDIYQKQGDVQSQEKELENAFTNPDLDLEAKLRVLTGYYMVLDKEDKRKTAIKLAATTIKQHPNSGKAYFMYADFLRVDGKTKDARDAYSQSVEIEGDNYQAWTSLLDLDAKLQDYDALVKHTEEGLELFPNHAVFWYMNGVGKYFKRQFSEAIESLEQAKMLASENKEMTAEIYKYLGEAYNATKEYAKSDAAYEEALSLSPHDLFILNNYSYYLALRKEKLNVAKELAGKLVKISPDQPSYLDTYGWVLYIAGDYKNAKIYLEKAAQLSNEGTILEHYGDVLFKLGQAQEALIQWQKAKAAGGTSHLIDKKIMDRKLYE